MKLVILLINIGLISCFEKNQLVLNPADENVNLEVVVQNEQMEEYLKNIDEKLDKLTFMVGSSSDNKPKSKESEDNIYEKYGINEKPEISDDEHHISNCITQIKNGEIEEAITIFMKISDPKRFTNQIVFLAYDKNEENAEKLLEMVKKLEDLNTKYIFIWAIFNEITTNLHLNDNFFEVFTVLVEEIKNSTFYEKMTILSQNNVKLMIGILKTFSNMKNDKAKCISSESNITNEISSILKSSQKLMEKLQIVENFNAEFLKEGKSVQDIVSKIDKIETTLKMNGTYVEGVTCNVNEVTGSSNRNQPFVQINVRRRQKNGRKITYIP